MGFLLSGNSSYAHVAISNGFHLEHFMLGQDPVEAAEEGAKRIQKLPGFGILHHGGKSDEIGKKDAHCRIIFPFKPASFCILTFFLCFTPG